MEGATLEGSECAWRSESFCRVSGLIAARGSALGRLAAFLTLPRWRSRCIASATAVFGSGARDSGRGGAGEAVSRRSSA